MSLSDLPVYDITKPYDWNYDHAPAGLREVEVPDCPGAWDFCGLPVGSPLGIPAGPLLNSRWLLYYARLGFDVLTYKTVRSSFRPCYELPNLLPVPLMQISGAEERVTAEPDARPITSWAISFGMPSMDPAVWGADVSAARQGLAKGQVLVVSVVASPRPDWSIDQIAADFRRCAAWAREAGAQAIEANLSCPNVSSPEGQIFASPEASQAVAAGIREAIGDLPLILKIGLFPSREQAAAFIRAVNGYATALSTVNSITGTVINPDGSSPFHGARRGIGGVAIRERSEAELALLAELVEASGARLRLIGVGGIFSAPDVRRRLAAGAQHVQLATAAMVEPAVAIRIRRELRAEAPASGKR